MQNTPSSWHAGDQVAFLAFSSSVFLGRVFIVFFLTVCGVWVAWIGWLVSHSSSMISQAFGSIGTVGRWWILLGKEVSISIKACQHEVLLDDSWWHRQMTWHPNHHSLMMMTASVLKRETPLFDKTYICGWIRWICCMKYVFSPDIFVENL